MNVEHWALGISFLALILSGASFYWSVYSWKNSGAKLKLSVSPSFTSGPRGTFPCIGITVDNAGRLQTSVNQLYFVLPNNQQLVFWSEAYVINHPPKVLAPGSTETFLLAASEFTNVLENNAPGVRKITLEVATGHGRFKQKISESVIETLVSLGARQDNTSAH